MNEETKEIKTNTGSVHMDKRKISTINFTDYAIERFKPSSFEWLTKDGKQRDRRLFPISGKTTIRGLKLVCFRKTGKKYFQLVYTQKRDDRSISLPLTIGEFIPGKFGVKECQEKTLDLLKEHTNDRGLWIKDPKQTLKD